MNLSTRKMIVAALLACLAGVFMGAWWERSFARSGTSPAVDASQSERSVLYWYDPMVPAQHFDKPGKSPFMDMQLVPRYADENADAASGIRVDPRLTQNLGVRLARVERRQLSQSVDAPGTVIFNDRATAIVQARAAGFVSRVYGRAPGDIVSANAALVDLVIPEWAAAQSEFLALLGSGDTTLIAASRQRLQLLGMSPAFIATLESTRQARSVITITAPIAGAIDTLEIRSGMAISPGATIATIKSIDPIWIEAAVPETAAARVRLGDTASVRSAAMPDRTFTGKVVGLLPQANADTHTLRVRIELANHAGTWRPGMFASVRLSGSAREDSLVVPTEAIIHTGTRDLVIVAGADHRFNPVEVRIGEQVGDVTRIVDGVQEGQQVVTSGQFLIDSEASLRGAEARMGSGAPGGTP